MDTDYYKILGVDRSASDSEIKKAFRKLCMITHPDKAAPENREAAKAKFQNISQAYEILGNAEKRKQYDFQQLNPFKGGMPTMPGMSGVASMAGMPIPPELFDILSGGMGAMFGGEAPQVFHMSGGSPMHMNMGGGFQKPEPIEKSLEISLEEAFTGKTKQISVSRTILSGGSRRLEKETLYISVPAGIDTNEIITIKDKGNIIHNNIKGDVKVIIKIKNYTKFKRHGIDLIYHKEISLKEALCGFDFDMEYIDGRVFKIKNDSGNIISNGYNKIIQKMGMTRENNKGDLIIKFKVIFPKSLEDHQIKTLREVLQ